jgi:ATP-dependent DNA helicase RecG
MRPEILFPLFASVTGLPGIGPRLAKPIEALAGPHVVDLCWHLPSGLIDRRFAPKIAEAPDGVVATLTITVEDHRPPPRGRERVPYRVLCSDETGFLTLVFFHAKGDYLLNALPIGEVRVVSGRVEHYDGQIQMTHPDHIVPLSKRSEIQTIEPVYPLTAGLTLKPLSRAIKAALERAPDLDEWLDLAFRKREGWAGWRDSLLKAHAPGTHEDLEPTAPARRRLAYDELLANQLALSMVKYHSVRKAGRQIIGDGHLRGKALAAFGHMLTRAQQVAYNEIVADLASPHRMLRLMQGDVGSGKTIVALLAMLVAVEAGGQAALLAPTEVLARQHAATLSALAEAAGVRLTLLTGRDKGKGRQKILDDLASGAIDILVGTHALIQEDVVFKDLLFAVIDEQHRFGVHQRMMLTGKGIGAVDVLVMTATPIPRTLSLTVYGDMDVSRITEKPPGRTPIDTRVLPLTRLDEVTPALHRALAAGSRVYWVCPMVDESEATDLAAATERHRALAQIFGDKVGLVHGQMKAADRDKGMEDFATGRTSILVATTVIEVGVDVPEATIMVVEHAERFGLAQLHQLRGRVGRGKAASVCLLLYAPELTDTARARLTILRETDDGFRIAEEDLRLRGAGEVLGTRQSGLPIFRLADLEAHADLLPIARDDAQLVLSRDPDLKSPRGAALKVLLYLFERDAYVKYFQVA